MTLTKKMLDDFIKSMDEYEVETRRLMRRAASRPRKPEPIDAVFHLMNNEEKYEWLCFRASGTIIKNRDRTISQLVGPDLYDRIKAFEQKMIEKYGNHPGRK